MLQRYRAFLRGVSVNWVGKLGVVLTTSAFVTFVLFELAHITGLIYQSYIGLISYLALPTLFVIGLVLIPIAWYMRRRATGLSTSELIQRHFDESERKGKLFGARLARVLLALTLVNVVFLMAASSRMLHFMDEPNFCGTACHSVMHPEWITYQNSPHARVACVECHVGEGVDALIDSKLNGMWQMISVTFNLYEKPIPTPVHQLRPAQETCEKCHWPAKFYGRRIDKIVEHQNDSASTPEYTTLALKVDAGSRATEAGIHWHIAAENEVRYVSVDRERKTMLWVDVKQEDNSFKRFNNTRASEHESEQEPRVMDCVDCHNRATHIYEDPAVAIDERLARGELSRSLPFIRREGFAAITSNYADSNAAMVGIENHLYGFYQRNMPDVARSHTAAIDSAITVLRNIYRRNIHHGMNVTWNAYPNHLNHKDGGGCFRCHNPDMRADDGSFISTDCTLCHSILAYDSPSRFEFLRAADTLDPNYPMHEYLRTEYLTGENEGAPETDTMLRSRGM